MIAQKSFSTGRPFTHSLEVRLVKATEGKLAEVLEETSTVRKALGARAGHARLSSPSISYSLVSEHPA